MNGAALTDAERRDWLRLSRTEKVGSVAFRHLVERFGSAARALAALPRIAAGAKIPSLADADAEIAAGDAMGARLIAACEPDFPPLLAAVDPPPPVIWVRGPSSLASRPTIAIVGARSASGAGQRFARSLAADLGEAGFVVVSGMARGVDAAAHEGSLGSGSIAVLAGGVDDVFPPENRSLYTRLIQQGAVVSERAMGRQARARDFPRRNRIISGLSLGVVVVEAELRSGSLTTARFAGEQGREVFAVPGSPLDPRARGTNDLIRQGAVLCEGAEDVIRNLQQPQITPVRRQPPAREEVEALNDEIDALRERLAALLSPTPIPRDELVRLTGAPAAAVYGALVELSLAGRAELLPGGMAASG